MVQPQKIIPHRAGILAVRLTGQPRHIDTGNAALAVIHFADAPAFTHAMLNERQALAATTATLGIFDIDARFHIVIRDNRDTHCLSAASSTDRPRDTHND